MLWTVVFHPDFEPEFEALALGVQDELLASATALRKKGPALGRPLADSLKGSKVGNLKELRFSADGGVWRVAFAFDRSRRAVLLVAADKSGIARDRFYRPFIKRAERRFENWNKEM